MCMAIHNTQNVLNQISHVTSTDDIEQLTPVK